MRLQQHINESSDNNTLSPEIINALKKVDKTFLKEIKGMLKFQDHYLIRGMRALSSDVTIKKTRTDRIPMDSVPGWHDAMNDAFQSKFGIRARSEAVFCSFQYLGYGNKHVIFPIGEHYFIYSKNITDLYNYEPSSPELYQKVAEKLIDSYDKTDSIRTLKSRIPHRTEIMMICKEYVAIQYSDYNNTLTLLDIWIEDNA
jgi:hypothetical protein